MPGWQLVIQLGSEQPLTGHLYHVSNAPEHKTSCVGVARPSPPPPPPERRCGQVWSGASPQQSSLFSKNEEDEPGKRRAGRARQGAVRQGTGGESGGERCEIHRGSCALVGS